MLCIGGRVRLKAFEKIRRWQVNSAMAKRAGRKLPIRSINLLHVEYLPALIGNNFIKIAEVNTR